MEGKRLTTKLITTAFVLLLGSWSVVARSAPGDSKINGKWSGELPNGRDGTISITFEFKVDGEKLTGSVLAPGDKEFPLVQGKVKGDAIFFKIEGDTPEYSGTITGDEIHMKQS